MKNFITLAVSLFSLTIFAQVGINNNTPKATLDITSKTTDGSKPEGLLPPRLTGDQIQTGDAQYTAAQTGVIIYATAAATTPSTKTANITAAGYYFYDGTAWQKLTSGAAVGDATTTGKGIVQLAGDLSGTAASPAIAANAVTSAKILDGTVTNADLATGTGGIYKGSGSLSGNTTVTQGANTLAFTSTVTNGFSVDGTTLSVDAVNDRVGIGTNTPANTLEINSNITDKSGLRMSKLNPSSVPTPNAVGLGVDGNGDVVVIGGATQVSRIVFNAAATPTGSSTNILLSYNSISFNTIVGSSINAGATSLTLPAGTYKITINVAGTFNIAQASNFFDAQVWINNSNYQTVAAYSTAGSNGGIANGTCIFKLTSTSTIELRSFAQVGPSNVFTASSSGSVALIERLN